MELTAFERAAYGKSLEYLQESVSHLRECETCLEDSVQGQAHRLARMELLH